MNIEQFLTGYICAALWSSTDESGEPLDATHTIADIDPATLAKMRADCEAFIAQNEVLLKAYTVAMTPGNEQFASGAQNAGHDFWLTRCGHGTGFWDRGLGFIGADLTRSCEAFGNVDLYIGDDRSIHS